MVSDAKTYKADDEKQKDEVCMVQAEFLKVQVVLVSQPLKKSNNSGKFLNFLWFTILIKLSMAFNLTDSISVLNMWTR